MNQRNTRINRRQISSVDADDLYAINSPLDGYVPSYDLSTGKFSWVLLPTTALEIDTDESGLSVQDALDNLETKSHEQNTDTILQSLIPTEDYADETPNSVDFIYPSGEGPTDAAHVYNVVNGGFLTKIAVALKQYTSDPYSGDIKFRITTVDGSNLPDLGNVLAIQTIPSSVLPASKDWVDIVFASPAEIQADQKIAIVMSMENRVSGYFEFYIATVATPNGHLAYNDGGWNAYNWIYDMAIKTYIGVAEDLINNGSLKNDLAVDEGVAIGGNVIEDITDAVGKKHEHSNKADLDNVSGTNTGDQVASTVDTNASGLSVQDALDAKIEDASGSIAEDGKYYARKDGAWAETKLNTNLTYYIDCDAGSDSNPGTLTEPFATIMKAITLIPSDLNGYTVNIRLLDNLNYNESIVLHGKINGTIVFTSNADISDNVLIQNVNNIFNVSNCKATIQIINLSMRVLANDKICVLNFSSNVLSDSCKFGDNGNTGTKGIVATGAGAFQTFRNASDLDGNKVYIGVLAYVGSRVQTDSEIGDIPYLALETGSLFVDSVLIKKEDYDSSITHKGIVGNPHGTVADEIDTSASGITVQNALDVKIEDADSDGKTYGRKDGAWAEFTILGLFETDLQGDLMPKADIEEDAYYEIDINGDIQPKE